MSNPRFNASLITESSHLAMDGIHAEPVLYRLYPFFIKAIPDSIVPTSMFKV